MSEKNHKNHNRKRDARDSEIVEASSISVSPLKKKKLDDSHVVVSSSSSSSSSVASSADSASVTSAGEDDEQSSRMISGCFSSESNEIAKNSPAFVVDLEVRQISESETEISTFITSNFRKERNPGSEALGETTETESKRDERKTPTPEEVEDFFSEIEDDDKQKRFIEKYNFDIVNDKPLQGRYKWDRLNKP